MDKATEIANSIKEFGIEALGRYYGIYRGFIEDNEDPEFLGRCKLKVPQVHGENDSLDYWAWSKGMFCGAGIGMFAIPNIGDMVWVSFEGGDPRFPVWEYGHYAKTKGIKDTDDKWKTNGNKPTNVVFQTTAGHRLEFENKDGSELVRLTNKQGYIIELNKNGISSIVPAGKKINLGTLNNAAEPAVLGDKNVTTLTDIKDLITTIQTILTTMNSSLTALAASYSAVGAADATIATGLGLTYATADVANGTALSTAVASISINLTNLATELAKLVTDIPTTKSQKVRLD